MSYNRRRAAARDRDRILDEIADKVVERHPTVAALTEHTNELEEELTGKRGFARTGFLQIVRRYIDAYTRKVDSRLIAGNPTGAEEEEMRALLMYAVKYGLVEKDSVDNLMVNFRESLQRFLQE